MKVLLTGGSGFIGQHVTQVLLDEGLHVRVFDLLPPSHPHVESVQGDILDTAKLERAALGCDAIVHLAAQVSVSHSVEYPEETHLNNVVGTQNVLSCAVQSNIKRIIIASSAAVYGNENRLPLKEETVGTIQSPYAHSKAENELQVLKARNEGLEVVALRFFNVYGPHQSISGGYSAVIPSLINCIMKGIQPTVHGNGLQTRDFVHADDVAASISTFLHAEWSNVESHVYNVATQSQVSIIELIDIITQICLETKTIQHQLPPLFRDVRSGDIEHSMANISKITAHLGWRPTISIHEGLRDLIEKWRKAE